jgi:hypothetical protein
MCSFQSGRWGSGLIHNGADQLADPSFARRRQPVVLEPRVEEADQPVNSGQHVELHAPDKQSLAASIATLLLTLPALGGLDHDLSRAALMAWHVIA